MKTKKLLIGAFLSLTLLTSLNAQSARDIMVKVDARDDGKSLEQDMYMMILE
jgi:hypothetical protein